MAKDWQNSGFVAKFLTKFTLWRTKTWHFFSAKSFGA